MILKQSQLMVPVKTQQSQMQLNQEQQVLIRHPSQTQRVVSLVVLEKKPHLCDVIEQSTQQIKQMQEIIQSNSITSDTLSKKREEDREFFRQMMLTMSQTMMRVTQMLMQGAASGYHPPNHAYTPPNYSFSSSGMGHGFYSPPARSSSSVTSETSADNDLSNLLVS